MKQTISKCGSVVVCCAIPVVLLGTLLHAASAGTSDIPVYEKVTGPILSRNGDLVQIKDKKSGHFVVVKITDNTKIERKRGHFRRSGNGLS